MQVFPGHGFEDLDSCRLNPLLTKVQPVGRAGEAWEVAKMVSYLASEDVLYVTGSSMVIDGGLALTSNFNDGSNEI